MSQSCRIKIYASYCIFHGSADHNYEKSRTIVKYTWNYRALAIWCCHDTWGTDSDPQGQSTCVPLVSELIGFGRICAFATAVGVFIDLTCFFSRLCIKTIFWPLRYTIHLNMMTPDIIFTIYWEILYRLIYMFYQNHSSFYANVF